MTARDLVSDLIPAVTGNDSGTMVLGWMDLYRVAQMPVVLEGEYLGLLSESDLLNLGDPELPLAGRFPELDRVSVTDGQHLFEVIEEFANHRLTLLPVLDGEKHYLGCIMLPDLLQHFSAITGSGQPGAILVMVMPARDYSLTNLARIIEENQSKVLNLYVTPVADSSEIRITLKINTSEIGSITRSLERYGYTVHSYFLNDEKMDDFYRSRYEELMKYMNV